MKKFKDADGSEWELAVSVSSNKRVKALTEGRVDLFSALDGSLFNRLIGDPELLVNVIYILCKPEAERREVSEEAFGELLVGDAIDSATTALVEDLTDFFPQSRRALMRRAVTKVAEFERAAVGRATATLDALDVETILRNALGGSSTASPANSASTPIPAP